MKEEMKQHLVLKLGEQLTGLSPTVCRRAIAAVRKEDERLGGESRKDNLPDYCQNLLHLLGEQIHNDFSYHSAQHRNKLVNLLNQAELFLDIVEGARKPNHDGEEESRRG